MASTWVAKFTSSRRDIRYHNYIKSPVNITRYTNITNHTEYLDNTKHPDHCDYECSICEILIRFNIDSISWVNIDGSISLILRFQFNTIFIQLVQSKQPLNLNTYFTPCPDTYKCFCFPQAPPPGSQCWPLRPPILFAIPTM